jgi:hypothetical protein
VSCGGEEHYHIGSPGKTDRAALAQNVCNFKTNFPNHVISTQIINGSVISGDASNSAIASLPTLWSSVYATRKVMILRTFDHPYRYVDASGIYGVGRAPTEEAANELAEGNCSNLADNFQGQNQLYSRNYDLKCIQLVTQQCY